MEALSRNKRGRFQPPVGSTQLERDHFYRNLKRVWRSANGRCTHCGQVPVIGKVTCERCLEMRRRTDELRRERQRAKREVARLAALPRRCPRCGGADLMTAGLRDVRQYFKCRTCGRNSFGNGPAVAPPNYPCPYCGGRCTKHGRALEVARKPRLYQCVVCGRINTNLWPRNAPSPGGPFPHIVIFGLNFPADQALHVYCQEKHMSWSQGIRDIFINAARVRPGRAVARRRSYASEDPMALPYQSSTVSVVLPTIPPGGIRLPSAHPAALEKMKRLGRRGKFAHSVLVARYVGVALSDVALASLMEMMRRRNLNHQDMARALIAETVTPLRAPIIISPLKNDLDDGW